MLFWGLYAILLNVRGQSHRPYTSSSVQRVHVSTLLKDAMVTDMVWGNKSDRLFFGDDQGRLAVSYMPKVC